MKVFGEMYGKISTRLLGFLYSEKGQGLVEYALILLLIALVIIAMLKGVGQRVNVMYSSINSGIQNP
ncbi:MAG TPA: Flp family type IVb pilin [Thermodesulfovibrionales bacterium]|nr:Flp family type IVb pilin [Thermodesulfovibrionales bacterium]